MPIPESFTQSELRGVLPMDPATERMGLSFNLHDGNIIRLSISKDSAVHIAKIILDYLNLSHSPMSSGMPSSDVSYPSEGSKV